MNHPIYTRIFEGLGHAKPPIHQASYISQVKNQIRYRSLEEILQEDEEQYVRPTYFHVSIRNNVFETGEIPQANVHDIDGIKADLAAMIIAVRIGRVCNLPQKGEPPAPEVQALWSRYFTE